ncbi:MAG: RNA polymerase sigma factor HrdD [marine actinobacterium MedAcidi-G3]|jgi:RNA polymerase primary sigma factor|nr:MAG: RNA polymerase sigma factor HrdD [marine actinobacterium MedAcidi-G3]MBA4813347.1 sigma-70 family RNA polymerase sigma factor [Acidimicrobiales bacterium]OUW86101.1 MAG: RNA polymerase subunit sigma [Acidimicrobiaceae bacterium TMED224]HBQ03831.1 RNA polymerase subunit sigma [Acidimicrobiaceae bacterium]HCJ85064.1 RNA polymerase subunit sigma [Acidimicrobiaceae bacterium]|tara:strand:+ start:1197 stop:2036 length:840 start_codon:yes stop_codon:yes gene_type:complete
MSDSVGQYLNEIGAVALLTADDEKMLSKAIEKGRDAQVVLDSEDKLSISERRSLRVAVREAEAARDRFIRANLRLVVSIARRYPLPPAMELLDLIQEGNLGLEHAVEKFDWRRGFKFSTYATFWIRQSIGRALDQKASLIRLPSDRSASLRAALRHSGGDSDGLDDENAWLQRISTPTSLDKNIGDEGDSTLVDLIGDDAPSPEDHALENDRKEMIRGLLDRLDPRAQLAVARRFGLIDGESHSYREVGEELGVTAEAARRLVKRAVDELREDALVIVA